LVCFRAFDALRAAKNRAGTDHRAASTGLTMRQRGEAPSIDPAPLRRIQGRTRRSSSIQNHGVDCFVAVRVR
jgi:hypothetical protein